MILKCFVDIHNAQRLKMMEGKYIIESNDRIHRLRWETNEMSYLITYEKQPLVIMSITWNMDSSFGL